MGHDFEEVPSLGSGSGVPVSTVHEGLAGGRSSGVSASRRRRVARHQVHQSFDTREGCPGCPAVQPTDDAGVAVVKEAKQAKAEDLRERAERQRKAVATEPNPTERKRKLTRASRSEEKADRLAGGKDDETDKKRPDDPDDDLPSHRVPTTKDGAPTDKAQRNFTDPENGKELYSRRKVIVEPVFGHIKEPRGFRRFSPRGVFKARGEWTLICLCHNLIKLLAPQPDPAEA
jgi:hypothetical protein